VVRGADVCDLEHQVLRAEVLLCAKGDWQAYTTYAVRSLAGLDPVEGFVTGSYLMSKSIFLSVSVKMMFKLLPPSMRVLGRKAQSTMGLTTSE
jgi:hypothetical protein